MSSAVEISVIVPAYNIEKYLAECLDSLRAQTFTNFECIVVNDGSSDKTESIAKKYVKEDERFRVVSKQNGGLSSARNAGYDVAKGKYVIFLDGDDFFAPELLTSLHAAAVKSDADIIICNYKLFYDGMKKYSDPKIDFSPLSGKTFSYKTDPDTIFSVPMFMVWNKLFQTEFLRKKQIRHNEESHRAEDIDFSGRALAEAEKVTYVDKSLSFYRTGTETSNVGTSYKYPYDVLWSLEGLKKYLVDRKLYKNVEKGFLVMAVSHILGNLFFTEMHAVHEDVYKKVKEFLIDCNASMLKEADFTTEKDYRELQLLLKENYIAWLRYRITDLRDNRESQYISYLLSEYQRKYKEELGRYEEARAEIRNIVNSSSWKLTRPLRLAAQTIRRLKH